MKKVLFIAILMASIGVSAQVRTVYEIINKGKGVISSITPSDLLNIKSRDTTSLQSAIEFGNSASLGESNISLLKPINTTGGTQSFFTNYDGESNYNYFGSNLNHELLMEGQRYDLIQLQYQYARFGISDGKINIVQSSETSSVATNVEFTPPIVNSTIKFPAKVIQKDYILSTLDDLVMSKLDEGNGNGYRLTNSDPLNYGNIGLDAVDLSFNDSPSDSFGATGPSSFAMGSYITAGNFSSVVFGNDIINNGIGSFDSGINLRDSGYTNSLFGIGHDVTSMNTTVVGQAANIISDQIVDFNATLTKPVFVVGNGTIANNDFNYTVTSRSDAFIARLNGSLEGPSMSKTLIEEDQTGKILITKEWASSGKYTPTLYEGNNSTGITSDGAIWTKLGNAITVTASISFTATTGPADTYFELSLPFVSDSDAINLLSMGSAVFSSQVGLTPNVLGIVRKSESNVRVSLFSDTDAILSGSVTFTYLIPTIPVPVIPLITFNENSKMWFKLYSGASSKQIIAGYNTAATDGVDPGYDTAISPIDGNTTFSFWSKTPAVPGYRASVNALGLPFSQDMTIGLGYYSNSVAEMRIELFNSDGYIDNNMLPVFLVDTVLGVTHNLRDGEYVFEAEIGEFEDRFYIKYIDNVQ